MFGIMEAVAIPRGPVYPTFEDLFKSLNEQMNKDGYKVVKSSSHKSRMAGVLGSDMIRCDMVCDRGGRPYKSTATKRKTRTKKTDCPWKAKAVNRKAFGGWVLTVTCDQHNHEPGTPEPPSADQSGAEDNEPEIIEMPTLDAETSSAVQVAGISEATLRLNGDTFNQLKKEYRKLSHAQIWQTLSTLQLRIAALYAVQNEEVQRQRRHEAQDKRHQQIDSTRRVWQGSVPKRNKRQRMSTAEEPVSNDTGQAVGQISPEQLLGRQLIDDPQLQLGHNTAQAAVPMPGIGVLHYQPYANHSKRGQTQNAQ